MSKPHVLDLQFQGQSRAIAAYVWDCGDGGMGSSGGGR